MQGVSPLALVGGLAPLRPDFDGTQLQPSASGLDARPYSPARTAWVLLASGQSNPLYVSLAKRYKAALASFKQVDFIICLSASNYTYSHTQAELLYNNWTSSLPGIDIRLVTTDDIGDHFPSLAPILPLVAQKRPFEWAHHEPTLLSVPNIGKYAYVWCLEIDATYKGNLTQWFADVHADYPQADFITWREGAPPPKRSWKWATEPNVYDQGREPRALYLDVPAEREGEAKRWRTGDEHLRVWCARPLST